MQVASYDGSARAEVRVCDDPGAMRVASCACARSAALKRALAANNGELSLWRPRRPDGSVIGHAVCLYQRRLWVEGPPPPILTARCCPFCGEPYVLPGEPAFSPLERAVLALREDPRGAAAALASLAERGLLDAGEATEVAAAMQGEGGA